jgi:hypothetical protein
MRKPAVLSALLAVGLALPVATVVTATADAAPAKPTGVKLTAALTGPAEVPGPGDADGTGTFTGRLNVGQGKLCYTLTSANLATLTMAHIHAGEAGKSGPPVVTLMANAPTETCMAVPKDVAQKIVAGTGGYYVNIHTSDHPAGAIRGQLTKG